MRIWAAQRDAVQHARAIDVIAVLRGPGRLGWAVDARMLFADQAAFFRPWHGLTPFPFPVRRGLAAERGDGVAHLLIGSAAADVAGQALLDLGRRRLGVLIEGGPHSDDEAGRAEA